MHTLGREVGKGAHDRGPTGQILEKLINKNAIIPKVVEWGLTA